MNPGGEEPALFGPAGQGKAQEPLGLLADKRRLQLFRVQLQYDALDGMDQGFNFLSRNAQFRILFLNATEHVIKGIGKKPDFILLSFLRANRIISLLGDGSRKACQAENWIGDNSLQPGGNQGGSQDGK